MSCCGRILVSETYVLRLVTCCGMQVRTHYFLSYLHTVGRIHDTYTDLSSGCNLDCGYQGFDWIGYVFGH